MDDGVIVLVSPQRRKYDITCKEDLEKLVGQLDLDAVLAGNLRQLCNFNTAGVDQSTGEKRKKGRADNWSLLHKVVWLQRKGSTTVEPTVGTADYIYKTIPGLKDDLSMSSLYKLLAPQGPLQKGVWLRVPCPPAALSLPSGSSPIGLSPAGTGSNGHWAPQQVSRVEW